MARVDRFAMALNELSLDFLARIDFPCPSDSYFLSLEIDGIGQRTL